MDACLSKLTTTSLNGIQQIRAEIQLHNSDLFLKIVTRLEYIKADRKSMGIIWSNSERVQNVFTCMIEKLLR